MITIQNVTICTFFDGGMGMKRIARWIGLGISLLAITAVFTQDSAMQVSANQKKEISFIANRISEEELQNIRHSAKSVSNKDLVLIDNAFVATVAQLKEEKAKLTENTVVQEEQMVPLEATVSESTVEVVNEYIVETPYDKEIFVENGIEFHYIAADTWQGLMAVIPDPSRVFVGMPREVYDGQPGASATKIAQRYGAQFAVNGSFFVDTNYVGNGGTPLGFVFSEGKQTYGGAGTVSMILGWDAQDNFVCETMSGAQAVERGIRDAVSCNPILVQNGEVADLSTKSMTLMDCRSAVGARADGSVLILMVDGRMSHSIGATTRSMADCFISFGAVSAGNLDGGGSVSIYYSGTPLEGLSSSYGGRAVPNAICVRPE